MAIRIKNQDYLTTIRDGGAKSKDYGKKTSVTPTNYGTGTEIGAYHLASQPHLYEIQRTNNFELLVYGLENLVSVGDYKKINNAQEVLRIAVTETSVPHFSQSPITVKRGNSAIKYAGVPEFGSGTIVINDYIGASAQEVLLGWQNLSYDVKTEKVGLVSDYKKEARLVEYTPDYQKVRSWVLHGCWVSEISEGNFSSEGNDKRTITATIQYDWAEVDTSDLVNGSIVKS